MGMYDYLGSEQVKVFGVACSPLTKKSKEWDDFIFQPYVSGGSLIGYDKGDEVPYRKLFYNYGKDFIIFDYRGFIPEDEQFVHVIKDGKYFDTYMYNNIPEDIEISSVVDYYGAPIKVKSRQDFIDIVNESRLSRDAYEKKRKEYEEKLGAFPIPSINERDKYSTEEIIENIKKLSKASDLAFGETLKLFGDKWISKNDSSENTRIHGGFLIGYVLDVIKNHPNLTEWERYKIVELFLNEIYKENYVLHNLIVDYMEWVGDLITEEEVVLIFTKYSVPPSQEVIDEYLKSDNKKFRDL